MRSTTFTLIGGLCMAAASSFGLQACSSDTGTNVGTGGGGPASGGTGGGTGGSAMGGTGGGTGGSAMGGTGGGTGGSAMGGTGGGTGGSAMGGTGGGAGGMTPKGGSGGMGTGGSVMMAGSGGSGAGTGGMSGSSSQGGAGSGSGGHGDGGTAGTGMGGMQGNAGTSSGDCVKGTKGTEVAVIGESFIALSHGITQAVEALAKAAGALGQSEHYVDNSVSGTTLANNQIPSQYDKAVQSSGTIKYVLMDGGGNDCLINNNGDAALTAATTLFQNMASHNTQKIVYFFYPDPIGSNFASLKSCLDALRPKMKALCDGLTAPKCYWIDLRDTWNGHSEYTSDGIHPTDAGSKATGDAIWKSMVANCVAQ